MSADDHYWTLAHHHEHFSGVCLSIHLRDHCILHLLLYCCHKASYAYHNAFEFLVQMQHSHCYVVYENFFFQIFKCILSLRGDTVTLVFLGLPVKPLWF